MASSSAPDGARWERAAQRELERNGLRLRAANVRYRGGELDLVMDDRDVLVFVEVRYRSGARFGGGAASVKTVTTETLPCAARAPIRPPQDKTASSRCGDRNRTSSPARASRRLWECSEIATVQARHRPPSEAPDV